MSLPPSPGKPPARPPAASRAPRAIARCACVGLRSVRARVRYDAGVRAVLFISLAFVGCSQPRPSEGPAPAPAPKQVASAAPAASSAAPTAPAFVEEPARCEETPSLHVFTSPATPWTGAPLRVVVVSDKPRAGKLSVDGATETDARHGGPPYFWILDVASPTAGATAITFVQKACEAGRGETKATVTVANRAGAPAGPPKDGVWPARGAWNRTVENMYSAWIETLFDAPDGEMPSWPALHEVLRDPKRNFLFDHLGAGEDSANAPVVRPDCADLPYFLRAYFAFKLRLPFGLAECNRGGGGAPPSCKGLLTNEDGDARATSAATSAATGKTKPGDAAVAGFGAFLRGTLADRAHSGSARAPFEDEASDYYPVQLEWDALRPGTIFADPYGHVLVVAKKLPQTNERGGVLLAVDGQPDGTVARKRYWRGNFLYATQRELGGPGFKRFRPLVRGGGVLARADDTSLAKIDGYGDFSRDAQKLDVEAFYDKMDDVLSPRPLDPERAMMETVAALEEQVRTRVSSVDNGRRWLDKGKGPATMPDGPEIFETTGAWEDFSTPSRDLRLLIAIDVVRGFPARVARRPERYAMPPDKSPKDVEADLAKVLERELKSRSVSYPRSDGSPFTLTLAEVLARAPALETAYNPNDCAELRWGATPGSDEAATCRAHAPADQNTRMETYRAWFHERRRPPRKVIVQIVGRGRP